VPLATPPGANVLNAEADDCAAGNAAGIELKCRR
jgi:hypothetical protein